MADNKVISNVDQVTAGWLTDVLSRSCALTNGEVVYFAVERGGGNWSQSSRLHLHYSGDARGELPERLFLKIVRIDLEDEFFGKSEVDYYTRDYAGVEGAPLLRCYDGHFSEEEGSYHLLLDDVSHSHVEARLKTPDPDYGLALAEGLAAMHARWWGAERLARANAPIHDAAHILRFVEIAQPGLGHILDAFADEFKPHWSQLMQDLYAHHPQQMVARTQNVNGFTLIHGDLNATNILVPRSGSRPLYLIDRQPFDWSLTTWLGVYDLAYAMVLDWDVELRRELEQPVLKHYHEHLIRCGVSGYTWEQLYHDYRLCAAMGVYIATEYCRGGINRRQQPIWMRKLELALAACDDLYCAEMWER